MPSTLSSNKRIAKNTIYLYLRMILMVLSLYTSRVVLDVLGVQDYGVYGQRETFQLPKFLTSYFPNFRQPDKRTVPNSLIPHAKA